MSIHRLQQPVRLFFAIDCDMFFVVAHRVVGAFQPSDGQEVDAGISLQLLSPRSLRAEVERDAVVCARDDERVLAALQPVQAIPT